MAEKGLSKRKKWLIKRLSDIDFVMAELQTEDDMIMAELLEKDIDKYLFDKYSITLEDMENAFKI